MEEECRNWIDFSRKRGNVSCITPFILPVILMSIPVGILINMTGVRFT
jgi:hypothetical protein